MLVEAFAFPMRIRVLGRNVTTEGKMCVSGGNTNQKAVSPELHFREKPRRPFSIVFGALTGIAGFETNF